MKAILNYWAKAGALHLWYEYIIMTQKQTKKLKEALQYGYNGYIHFPKVLICLVQGLLGTWYEGKIIPPQQLLVAGIKRALWFKFFEHTVHQVMTLHVQGLI